MSQPRRFLQLPFHHPQKGWRMVNYHQSERVEQVPAGSAFQDGINILSQGCPPQRGLDGQVGPPGCLPYSAHIPPSQEIPKVSMESTGIPVPVPSFRVGHGSQSLYKTHEAGRTCLRQQGMRLVQYLEDTLLVAESPEALKAYLRKAANLLEELGFLLNKKKCVWTLTQRIEFLGLEVDSNTIHLYTFLYTRTDNCALRLPHQPLLYMYAPPLFTQEAGEDQEGMQECESSRPPDSQKADWTAYLYHPSSATSTTTLPSTAAPQGESVKTQSPLLQHQNPSGRGRPEGSRLVDCSCNRIQWQTYQAPKGRENNASTTCWGASCQGVQTGGPWDQREAQMHINWLELKAAFLALETFAANRTNVHVLLLLDNRTAIALRNKKGSPHSKNQIWQFSSGSDVWWRVSQYTCLRERRMSGQIGIRDADQISATGGWIPKYFNKFSTGGDRCKWICLQWDTMYSYLGTSSQTQEQWQWMPLLRTGQVWLRMPSRLF